MDLTGYKQVNLEGNTYYLSERLSNAVFYCVHELCLKHNIRGVEPVRCFHNSKYDSEKNRHVLVCKFYLLKTNSFLGKATLFAQNHEIIKQQ